MDTPPILPPVLDRTHHYKLLRSDLFIGQLLAMLNNQLIMGMFALLMLFAGGVTFFSQFPPSTSLAVRLIVAIFGMAIAFLLFCVLQLSVVALMVFGRAHKGLLGFHTLVLTGEGLIEKTDYNETLHRWKGVHKIRDTSGYLFIYVSESIYHQVPKDSFASVEEQQNFLAEVRHRSNL